MSTGGGTMGTGGSGGDAAGGVDVETRPADPALDEGDHDRFAHYVIGGNEAIVRSMVTGEPVTALCGKVWVPSRDPERYPVCPRCDEIKKSLRR